MISLSMINHRFEYKTDIEKYQKKDAWIIPKNFVGDCEDYALLVAYHHVCKGSIFAFIWAIMLSNICFHRVHAGHQLNAWHCVLEFDGVFIDNWEKRFLSKAAMSRTHSFIRKRGAIEVFWLLAKGWCFKKK